MENRKPVACWHHGDKERLCKNLKRGFIDIYGKDESTDKGTNRQNRFLRRMRLKSGDRIRIRVDSDIVACATIVDGTTSELPENLKREMGRPWGARIRVKDVCCKKPPQPASCSPNFQGSHRFDTKKASQLHRCGGS